MVQVHTVKKEDWAELAEPAHRAIFGEGKPSTQDRIDFALLGVDSVTDDVLAYVTCKEISPTTLYWSYGGAFPLAAKRLLAWRCLEAFLARVWELKYHQVFYLVENTNAPMLKMAAHADFRIVGLRHVEGATLLEHRLEAPRGAA